MGEKKIKNKTLPGFIIIPGNPGIADYYYSLKDELNKFYPYSPILVLGYQGFGDKPPERLYSITEEYEMAKKRITAIMEEEYSKKNSSFENADIRWILIGHSIGGWIVLRILDNLRTNHPKYHKRIESVFLLFPFLASDPLSIQQEKLKKKLKNQILVKAVIFLYKLLRFLPRKILRILLHPIWKGMDESAKQINEKYFLDYSHIPTSVIYCAKTEFDILPKELSGSEELACIESNNEKIFLHYTPGDIWAPIHQKDFLQKSMKKNFVDRIVTWEDMDHDFCVKKNQTVRMAERIYHSLGNFH